MGILSFILLLNPVYSEDIIEIGITPIRDEVVLGGESIFRLDLTNNQGFLDSFRVVAITSGWSLGEEAVRLEANNSESVSADLILSPIIFKESKTHPVEISIISNKDDSVRIEKLMNVKILDLKEVVDLRVEFPETFKSKDSQAKIIINNNGDYGVNGLSVNIDSRFFSGKKEFSLDPGENVELVDLNFEDEIELGNYLTTITVYAFDNVIFENEQDVELKYFSDENQIISPESGFLIKKLKISKINDGDTLVKETFNFNVGVFDKFFTSSNIEPSSIIKEGNQYIYSWDLEIQPNETLNLEITTNFRLLAIGILIVLGLVILLYAYLRRDLSLEKKVINVKHMEDGESIVNVVMTLKNKSFKEIKNIKLFDIIKGHSAEPKFAVMKPSVNKETDGIKKLVWTIPKVEGRGEIVIAYSVKMKLRYVESLSLPRAFAKYHSKGRALTLASNNVKMFGY